MAFQPPRLGPGAVYQRSLDAVFRSHPDLIRVAEIEPQTLWTKSSAAGSLPRGSPGELRHLSALPQRLLTHGVGCPIGGLHCDERQAPEFRLWNEALQVPWTSEHLSIFHVRGAHGPQPCGFLMPPLQTEVQVQLAATNIVRRTTALGLPFAFETGVNYFAPRHCEMPDGEFFTAVAEAADCGILLDLANLMANERNGRATVRDVVRSLPPERIWEVHLAGLEFAHGHWLDAHAGGIDEDVIAIAAEVVASLPNLGALVFEISPDRLANFGEKGFLREMEKLHRLWEKNRTVPAAKASPQTLWVSSSSPSPESWEKLIAARMLPTDDQSHDGIDRSYLQPSDERSFSLYTCLAASFRTGAIAELLEHSTRLLLLGLGETALRALMDRYVADTPPVAFPTDEVLSFRRYLQTHPVPVPGLEDVLNFESTLVEAAVDNATLRVELSRDIDALLGDIAMGRLPEPSSDCPGAVLEIGVDPAPFVRMLH
ncbi:DUF692 family multinuclear iron-containing protein [Terriglobus saanensis]|uniref:DUF692 domain-containing protein n=1 Tax=Terriglobus saanensis (strain ATCC BAA-1853 / DSM 23119 / SP1PR4) TaxID=401053 RepID=E8UY54_TERSS|nr:DUF692 family multinuclear iron-containing protein [Terriglobus saanensis]ADV80864.1 protein of unknown function DUF692 [Terriglobus saanensis SP1PR4]